jgi:hypothetical protein
MRIPQVRREARPPHWHSLLVPGFLLPDRSGTFVAEYQKTGDPEWEDRQSQCGTGMAA